MNIELQQMLSEIAALIEQQIEPEPRFYDLFFQQPDLAFKLVDLIDHLEEDLEDSLPIYSACIFGFEVCVSQLQALAENHKNGMKALTQLMGHLAALMNGKKHTLNFWLPLLNSFYESKVDLTQELQDAYFDLIEEDEQATDANPISPQEAIRSLILEMGDQSVFDIAEHFFVQSYAMPPEFFADLLMDLYQIPEGKDIVLLFLLHPKADVRDMVVQTLNEIIDQMTFSSASLARLQTIFYWYPEKYHAQLNRWIKIQRKKGVVFTKEENSVALSFRATEVDGMGAQGLFIHVRQQRAHRLCGLLLKYDIGLKDTWITPEISAKDVKYYYSQAFDDSVTLREVDLPYFSALVEHFLAYSVSKNEVPGVQFLEMQELLGLRLRPNPLNLEQIFEEISVQISPFNAETIHASLQRSKAWLKTKAFTESWYVENALIDKIVNHHSSFVDGVRLCDIEDAMLDVFEEDFEPNRQKWLFHFLWISLWLKAKSRANEKAWQDSFMIAYLIYEGKALKDIPVMQEVCRQTVLNSAETMQERRTHLNQE